MKIGIDISQLVHQGTGVGNYTRNIVANLINIDRRNTYILFGQSLRKRYILEEFYSGLKGANVSKSFWSIPPTASDLLFNVFRFPIENFTGKLDIFHSSDWTQPKSRAAKITTVHDLVIYKFPEVSHPKIVSVQKRWIELVRNECQIIIVDSIATKHDLIDILHFDVKKIRVVYLAAGEMFTNWRMNSLTRQKSESLRVKEKYSLKKQYLLAVGTREPRKNFDRLVEAFIQSGLSDVDLVVVGKAGWGDKNKLFESDSTRNIKYLNYVEDGDLTGLYSGACAFLYTSLYEGFGVPILEAMNCGTPVLTSHISSMPEVAGKDAIYVDPLNVTDMTEKITYLAKLSYGQRNQMVEAGYQQSLKFSWNKTAKDTLSVYEELA